MPAVNSISFSPLHARPMWALSTRAGGEPNEIKENTHPKNATTALVLAFADPPPPSPDAWCGAGSSAVTATLSPGLPITTAWIPVGACREPFHVCKEGGAQAGVVGSAARAKGPHTWDVRAAEPTAERQPAARFFSCRQSRRRASWRHGRLNHARANGRGHARIDSDVAHGRLLRMLGPMP